MSQLEIHKWAQGKQPLLAVFCQQLAIHADIFLEIFTYVKNQESIPFLPKASVKEWLWYYRNHRHLERILLNAFQEIGGIGGFFAGLYPHIRSQQKRPAPLPEQKACVFDPKQQEQVNAALQAISQLSLTAFQSEIQGLPLDEETIKKAKAYLVNPEFLFLSRVYLPCILIYGVLPFKLFRQARLGNHEALEKLIRLDIMILADHRIIRHISWLQHRNKYKYDAVFAIPARDAPKFKLSPKSLKCLLAGMISLCAEISGNKLEEPDIRALFNAIACDRSGGAALIDSDLPDAPGTFSKAIQRHRHDLKVIFCPDKTF